MNGMFKRGGAETRRKIGGLGAAEERCPAIMQGENPATGISPRLRVSALQHVARYFVHLRAHHPHCLRVLVTTLCFGFGFHAAAQTLANGQFNVQYTSSGIASLKHVQDAYDTDYMARGKTLGDVL